MNTGGESAEQLMRMMLNGSEVLIRLTGSGAKNVAVLLYSVLREQKKTKGATRLSNMLRSGKKLRVYTFRDKDLPKFKEVAKQYGILYTILKEKDHTGGVFDVLVRAEDEHKLARVMERFKFSSVDTASLRAEILKEKQERQDTQKRTESTQDEKQPEDKEQNESRSATDERGNETEHTQPEDKSESDTVADELMAGAKEREKVEERNPVEARAEENRSTAKEKKEIPNNIGQMKEHNQKSKYLSEPSFNAPRKESKENSERSNNQSKSLRKPSVRKRMEQIRRERMNNPQVKVSPPIRKSKER